GGAFPRSEREGDESHPRPARRKALRFHLGRAPARQRHFRRTDPGDLRHRLPPPRVERARLRALRGIIPPPHRTRGVVLIFEGKHVIVLERGGWEYVERKKG